MLEIHLPHESIAAQFASTQNILYTGWLPSRLNFTISTLQNSNIYSTIQYQAPFHKYRLNNGKAVPNASRLLHVFTSKTPKTARREVENISDLIAKYVFLF